MGLWRVRVYKRVCLRKWEIRNTHTLLRASSLSICLSCPSGPSTHRHAKSLLEHWPQMKLSLRWKSHSAVCQCASLVTWDCATVTRGWAIWLEEVLSLSIWGNESLRVIFRADLCLWHVILLLEVLHLLKGRFPWRTLLFPMKIFVVWTTGPAIASRIRELHVRCGRSRVLLRREQNRSVQANADKAPGPQ